MAKKNVLLGITGSIAAYKAAEIAHLLVKRGHDVEVIMTAAGAEFITPLTLQTLIKHKVYMDMFEPIAYEDVRHISLAQKADVAIIAPASANCIGKLASGIADDMLTTGFMAIQRAPKIICPAMNTAMYENPVVQDNIAKLKTYGYLFVEPKSALLACGDTGKGALEDVDLIVETVVNLLEHGQQ
jgi:phosphopantothenoylcysteine decarboxylase/phosphopantothenoylcysteine decarboxylase/phosphopantothenate--cysteine ligase